MLGTMETEIPSGLCQCGCGQPTRRAPYASAPVGWVKGEWTRFVLGHNLKTTPRYAVDPETGCWNTLGGKTRGGYGKITHGRRTILLHRWMYEQHVGPIPPGKQVHHTCRNVACCNPEHLTVVTRSEHRRIDMAKLTSQDVRDIRLVGSFGVVRRRIAERFGVSSYYVGAILRGEVRKDG